MIPECRYWLQKIRELEFSFFTMRIFGCMWADGVLELAEAIKKYYDDLNLPPMVSSDVLKL